MLGGAAGKCGSCGAIASGAVCVEMAEAVFVKARKDSSLAITLGLEDQCWFDEGCLLIIYNF